LITKPLYIESAESISHPRIATYSRSSHLFVSLPSRPRHSSDLQHKILKEFLNHIPSRSVTLISAIPTSCELKLLRSPLHNFLKLPDNVSRLKCKQRGRGENFRRYFAEGQADIFGRLCARNTFYLLTACFTTISIAQCTHSRMIRLLVRKKLEIMCKEEIVAQLEAGVRNFLQRLRATTRCLRHDNRFPGRDLNPGPSEFYATMLPTSLQSSVTLNETREC